MKLKPIERDGKGRFQKGVKHDLDRILNNSEKHKGKKGIKHSEESRKKISEATKKVYNTLEYKKKISEVRKIVFNQPDQKKRLVKRAKQMWAEGKFKPHPLSEETKEKIRNKAIGRVQSKEQMMNNSKNSFIKAQKRRTEKLIAEFAKKQAKELTEYIDKLNKQNKREYDIFYKFFKAKYCEKEAEIKKD